MTDHVPAITVLYVPIEAPGELVVIDSTLSAVQTLVGGLIEAVTPHPRTVISWAGEWHAYCDEEGKLKGLPINYQATTIAEALGWITGDYLRGPVVFLGGDEDGSDDSIPSKTLGLVQDMYGWDLAVPA